MSRARTGRAGLVALACATVLTACNRPRPTREVATGAAVQKEPTATAEVPGPKARKRQFGANYFPNVELRTHDGRTVRFYDDLLKNKIVVLNLFYAKCTGSCPPVMGNLSRVQEILKDRIGKDIFMYSITIKPEEDTPEVLAEYADNLGVGPGWSLLTGDPADIELLRRRLGYVDPDPKRDADKSNHVGMVRYGNEALERWGASPGAAKPEWLARSILFVDHPVKAGAAEPQACCAAKPH
jgi:protein SCO1